MSGFYDPNNPHGFPHIPPPLPEFPENIDQAPGLFYDNMNPLVGSHELSSANLARWFEQDGGGLVQEPKGAPRIRRRVASSGDLVKHRRTRSGCYTCRSRRVKCDETHPICERCMKGSRECVYPDPSSTVKGALGTKLGQQRKVEEESGSSSGEYEDEEVVSPVSSKPHGELLRTKKSFTSNPNLKAASRKQSRTILNQKNVASMTSEKLKEKSLSPSTDESLASKTRSDSTNLTQSGRMSTISPNTQLDDSPWSHLHHDQQFFLAYHQQNMTHHHYFFRNNASQFVHSTLIKFALTYDPLLYAIVGFSAFHYTVNQPNGRIPDFLGFYNKSVSLLRKSLQSNHKHTDATILTILQLAAFEEYLGDFVNLMEHQKAACEMLREIYTPETISQTETRMMMMQWYARFDLFVALTAGNETDLEPHWYYSYAEHCSKLSQRESANVELRLEAIIGQQLFIAVRMAHLNSGLSKGKIAMSDFMEENKKLGETIQLARTEVESLRSFSDYLITSFDGSPKADPEDIVDPYEPGVLFREPLWSVNRLMLDVESSDMMHKLQMSLITQQPPSPDLTSMALKQCQRFEAIEYYPESPPGAVISASTSLGLLVLFVPRDEKHISWCRRKLAKIERLGYIWPPTFRSKIAELWSMPSINHWWLPDETEYPRIIRAIRAFIQERTTKPRSQVTEDIRAMRAIFSNFNMDDSPKDSPESADSLGEPPERSTVQGATSYYNASGKSSSEPSTGPHIDQLGFQKGLTASVSPDPQEYGQEGFARPHDVSMEEFEAWGQGESIEHYERFHHNQYQGPS